MAGTTLYGPGASDSVLMGMIRTLAHLTETLNGLVADVLAGAVPADGSVTDAKVSSAAAIAQAKIAGLVSALSTLTAADATKLAIAGHTSDSIPAASGGTSLADLAVPASSFVGRKATGGVAALTGAEAAALIPTGTFDEPAARHAVHLSVLPGYADNRYTYNMQAITQDSVVEYNGKRYAIWTNDSQHVLIGQQTRIPDGSWTTTDLSALAGSPLGATTAADLHNAYSIGVDSLGYVHVAGNMHGDNLRYVRSTNPEDITAWSAGLAMTGQNETLVSYPRFLRHPDGTLMFTYRKGSSGNGDNYMKVLTTAAVLVANQVWTDRGKYIEGTTAVPTENAYHGKMWCGSDGILRTFFAWTPSGDARDLSYAQTADKGVTWTKVDGTPLTLPIRHADAIVYPADASVGLINSCPCAVDNAGRPHTVNLVSDGTNRQFTHIWWNGSAWVSQTLSALSETGLSSTGQPTSPIIFCDKRRNKIYVAFHHRYDNRRGSVRVIDVDEPYTDFSLVGIDMWHGDMSFDMAALRDQNKLVTLCGTAVLQPNTTPDYNADDNWSPQWLGVLTVDLNQMAKIRGTTARLPYIRHLGTATAPADTSVTSTSYVTAPSSASLMTAPDLHGTAVGGLVMVRLSVRGKVSDAASTLAVQIQEAQQGGSNRSFATLTFPVGQTSSKTMQTRWIPLKFGPRIGGDSELRIMAKVTGGGTGTLISAALHYGVLAGPGSAVV